MFITLVCKIQKRNETFLGCSAAMGRYLPTPLYSSTARLTIFGVVGEQLLGLQFRSSLTFVGYGRGIFKLGGYKELELHSLTKGLLLVKVN